MSRQPSYPSHWCHVELASHLHYAPAPQETWNTPQSFPSSMLIRPYQHLVQWLGQMVKLNQPALCRIYLWSATLGVSFSWNPSTFSRSLHLWTLWRMTTLLLVYQSKAMVSLTTPGMVRAIIINMTRVHSLWPQICLSQSQCPSVLLARSEGIKPPNLIMIIGKLQLLWIWKGSQLAGQVKPDARCVDACMRNVLSSNIFCTWSWCMALWYLLTADGKMLNGKDWMLLDLGPCSKIWILLLFWKLLICISFVSIQIV